MNEPKHLDPGSPLVQHIRKTSIPATLIIGHSEKGVEFAFRKSCTVGWMDLWRECVVAQSYIDSFVIPNVRTVRFTDDFEMSRAEWIEDGTPLELSVAVIAGKKLARELVPVDMHFDKVLKVG